MGSAANGNWFGRARRTTAMEAVLFDMDGVIVDSERYWPEYEEERILPAADLSGAEPGDTTGMNYKEICGYLTENYDTAVGADELQGIDEECAADIYTERAELMDGFRDLCGTLRDRGVRVAIVTSSPPDWIEMVCDRFDLTGFDATISAEEIDGPGKPEPDIYRRAAEAVGVDPADCIAVEDSVHGVASATAAGTTCIGYRGGSDRDLDLSAADAVVDGPQELRAELLAR